MFRVSFLPVSLRPFVFYSIIYYFFHSSNCSYRIDGYSLDVVVTKTIQQRQEHHYHRNQHQQQPRAGSIILTGTSPVSWDRRRTRSNKHVLDMLSSSLSTTTTRTRTNRIMKSDEKKNQHGKHSWNNRQLLWFLMWKQYTASTTTSFAIHHATTIPTIESPSTFEGNDNFNNNTISSSNLFFANNTTATLIVPPTISIVPSINTHTLFVADSRQAQQKRMDKTNGTLTIRNQQTHQQVIDKEKDIVPSYQRLIVFCSTTFLIWLSEPLLSLVDITIVGITQPSNVAVIQLASLGPATTLIDSMMYLTYFLAIATTNQIAALVAIEDYKQLQITTSHILGVAIGLGICCTMIVMLFAPILIHNMAGLSGTPLLIQYATKYSYIRGSVAVCSVTSMVMQALCLSTLNTKIPFLAVLASSITNIIGDILLGRRYGVIGAAFATAASTVVSCSILLSATVSKVNEWYHLEQQQQQQKEEEKEQQQLLSPAVVTITPTDSNVGTGVDSVIDVVANEDAGEVNEKDSTKVLIVPNNDKPATSTSTTTLTAVNSDSSSTTIATTPPTTKRRPFIAIPDRQSAWKLVLLSGPIFFVILSKILCYSAMTMRCTDYGVEALAAHSIMMRIFFFYGCFGDSVSQTAQSFLPVTLYPTYRPQYFKKIMKRLFLLACVIGIFNKYSVMKILFHCGRYLTNDATIIQLMKDQRYFIGYAILLHPLIVLLEGTVIASRHFQTLIQTYSTTVPLHFIVLTFCTKSFPNIWRTFFIFQSIRLTLYSIRVFWLGIHRKQNDMLQNTQQQ